MNVTPDPHTDTATEAAAFPVHIVDDDPVIRDALSWLFMSRGIDSQCWPSGEAFLAAWHMDLPGCVLLDIRMGGMSGLEVFSQLRARRAWQPVVFLSGHGDLPLAVDALKQGAADFIEKPFDGNVLVDRVVAAGLAGQAQRASLTRIQARDDRLATLTSRERDVLDRLLRGLLNKQIADELGVTMRTIEVHRARILDKMEVRNVVELARLFGH